MIKAILIDLDGVLRLWNPEQDRQAEQAAGLPAGAIRRVAFSSELLLPAITGRVSDETWRQQISTRLRLDYPQADAEQAVQRWSAPSGEVNLAVLEGAAFSKLTLV
jgi:putative hydrolase of the HAD superfamily